MFSPSLQRRALEQTLNAQHCLGKGREIPQGTPLRLKRTQIPSQLCWFPQDFPVLQHLQPSGIYSPVLLVHPSPRLSPFLSPPVLDTAVFLLVVTRKSHFLPAAGRRFGGMRGKGIKG